MTSISALAPAIEALPRTRHRRSTRAVLLRTGAVAAVFILLVVVMAVTSGGLGVRADFGARSLAPGWAHPFGTDQLGRDLFARTCKGLVLSLQIGLLAACLSTLISLSLAIVATLGRFADAFVSFLVDMAMGLPHLVLLILISFACGGGTTGVVLAVALSHWPRLTRVLRAELRDVLTSDYVRVAAGFGVDRITTARRHLLPHLVPQLLVGFLLMFPHAILHEAGLTFLGFGLEPNRPAIGVMLAEAMRYLTAGYWWLGVFPGVALVILVLAFDAIGNAARALLSPREAQL